MNILLSKSRNRSRACYWSGRIFHFEERFPSGNQLSPCEILYSLVCLIERAFQPTTTTQSRMIFRRDLTKMKSLIETFAKRVPTDVVKFCPGARENFATTPRQRREKRLTFAAWLKFDNRRAGALADLRRGDDPRLVGLVQLQLLHLVVKILRQQIDLGDLHLLALIQNANVDGVLNEQAVRSSRRQPRDRNGVFPAYYRLHSFRSVGNCRRN